MNYDFQIAKYINSHKIYVDTCSLMHDNAEVFFSRLIPELERNRAKIYTTHTVGRELTRKSIDPNMITRAKAKSGYEILMNLFERKLIEYVSPNTRGDAHADYEFDIIFTAERKYTNLLMITQDKYLINQLLSYNHNKAVYGKKIKVFSLTEAGNARERFTDTSAQSNYGVPLQQLRCNKPAYSPQAITKPFVRNINTHNIPPSVVNQPKYTVTPKKSKNTEICTECGAPFKIKIEEAKYLLSIGHTLPKCCPICRAKRTAGFGNAGKISYGNHY